MPIKVIARVLGCSKNTVKKALAAEGPPAYRRRSTGSVVDAVEPRIRELLQASPRMPATVIAERIEWPYSIRTLSARVAELRPVYLPPDLSSRTTYLAGEIVQCDFWFPPIRLPVGFGQIRTSMQLPVLTMITGYARWVLAVLVPTRRAEDLYAGWWRLLHELGAVPRVLVWDGEGAVGRWRGGRSELTEACQGFRGTLGTKVLICRPADRQRMLTLPPVAPVTGWRASTRLARDHYVRLDGNDYSVHPAVIGRRIEVLADLHRVRGLCDGRLVADHERHRVLFATATEWVTRLAEAHHAGRLQDELRRLGRYPLLVVDEVGYVPFEPEAANLFFQLVSSRYERASLIVTSNKPFGRWGEVFGDEVVAAAMIDRLIHHAEVISLKGDSYRLKDRDLGRSAAATEDA